jgi:hypothetical protein
MNKTLKQLTCEYVLLTVIDCKGDFTKACNILDVKRATFNRYMKEARSMPELSALVDEAYGSKKDRGVRRVTDYNDEFTVKRLFPSNEERIRYLNTFPNRYK